MVTNSNTSVVISWILTILFIVIGILNMVYVHLVPGLIYLLVAMIYLPPFNKYILKKFGLAIPIWIKYVLAFLILWATLGVGDLMEIFEAKMRD